MASTKTELEATKAKLESTIGDLGVQSGLIAHTRRRLEVLKHKGDRNYYEFTLLKGAKPQPVSTVSLQLKKIDPKQRQVHHQRHLRRQDHREERPERQRADAVLYRARSHAVRDGGLDRRQEQSHRILEHAEECAGSGDGLNNERSAISRAATLCCEIALRTAANLPVVLIRRPPKRQARSRADDAVRPDAVALAISNAVQNAMTGPDTSLIGGVMAASTLLFLNYLVAEISGGNRRFRKLFKASPACWCTMGKSSNRTWRKSTSAWTSCNVLCGSTASRAVTM